MLNVKEAQELHELIGAAIETGDVARLARALELASVVVSDAEDREVKDFYAGKTFDRKYGPSID